MIRMNAANFVCIFLLVQICDAVRVHLNHGIIEGTSVSVGPHTVHVYKNIPFAEPPLGELRFQAPQPKKPWFGVRDGTKYARPCMSNTSFTTSPQKNVSEDCLYLNIFADERCLRRSCPILYYIHGGNFYYDSAVMFNDTEIIRRYGSDKLVFVIPAYRLGLFGFLDTGHELNGAPYNVGIQDLIFALRWVQREGLHFGGDIRRIAAMGNSGGASALQMLMASPELERNTFDKVIISSGMIRFGPHQNLIVTQLVSERVNCKEDKNGTLLSPSHQLKCLRRVPADVISDMTRLDEEVWTAMGPQSDDKIFPAFDYAELMDKYFKPSKMLIITTTDEMVERPRGRDKNDMCRSVLSPFGYRTNQTVDACVQFYTDNNYDQIFKDIFHATSVKFAIENRRRGKDAFVGVFAQVNHSHHANDLTYFFGLHPIANKTENDKRMDAFYPKVIKQFIKTGVPDPEWKPVNKRGENYFLLNFDQNQSAVPHLVEGEIYAADRVGLWLNTFAEVEWNATHNKTGRTEFLTHQRMFMLPVKEDETLNSSQLIEDQAFIITSSQIWVAFWTILSLAIILATIILVLTASRLMFTYQSNREYSIATAGEGTKILSRQVRKYV